jgi:predicted Rossmann fold nucleotide-binding protein DprA/Smf involved in DNA uptake
LTTGGIGVHAFFDDTYPAQLRDIREMPPLLFSRGDLRALGPDHPHTLTTRHNLAHWRGEAGGDGA